MYSTGLMFRVVKTLAVLAVGLMGLLVVAGNVTDYYTNYYFVQHVMSMDTTFAASNTHYRALHQPLLFNAGYVLLITAEAVMAFCCIKGGWLLMKNIKQPAAKFYASKNWAVAGLATGIFIWFVCFEVVGGEWFNMWQSTTWNGLYSADRIVTFITLSLILLHLKDEELK
jgi:predicted small integral membrane protein